MSCFAINLKNKRVKKEISQQDFAKVLGVAPSTACMWESGERTPKIEMVIKIAEVIGCTVDELLKNNDGSPDEKNEQSRKEA